jgi:hypothetical protein
MPTTESSRIRAEVNFAFTSHYPLYEAYLDSLIPAEGSSAASNAVAE